jgi:putative acyl-CoA dehydrogenase
VKPASFRRKLIPEISDREGAAMVQATFATHEVFNQSPPFEDVDLFTLDRPLIEAVAANGGPSASKELSEFGQHWGSGAMAARGRIANENTPKLCTFDSRGNRRDEVEFHPAYHELMARSAHAGIHNSTWNSEGKPAGAPAEVVRAAKFYMAAQVETGHLCPITMVDQARHDARHGHDREAGRYRRARQHDACGA